MASRSAGRQAAGRYPWIRPGRAWRDAKLKAGAKPNTVRLDLAVISHLFTIAAKEWGLPVDNPCARIRMPSAGQGREVRMSPAQEAAIIQEAAKINPELPDWIVLAVETGMRRGEIAGLRREWITGRVARLPDTKNGTARSVPLSSQAVAAVESLPANPAAPILTIEMGLADFRPRKVLRFETPAEVFQREILNLTNRVAL